MKRILIAAFVLGMASSASAQGFLSKANNLLGRMNGSIRSLGSGQIVRSAPSAINQQSPQQAAAQAQALQTPLQTQIATDRTEAKPLIEKLVMTSACAVNTSAWNSLNRFMEKPTTWSGEFNEEAAIANTKYHSKNHCLDIIRISDWQKEAKNAVSFTVYMVSSQSDEAKHQRFALVKSDEGEWLVRSIGSALF